MRLESGESTQEAIVSRSSHFEITTVITSWIVLHSVQLLLLIQLINLHRVLAYWEDVSGSGQANTETLLGVFGIQDTGLWIRFLDQISRDIEYENNQFLQLELTVYGIFN